MIYTFQDPPKSRGGPKPTPLVLWLRGLQEHPNRWAVWPEPFKTPKGNAARYLRRYGTQTTCRSRPDGLFDFYARYVDGATGVSQEQAET